MKCSFRQWTSGMLTGKKHCKPEKGNLIAPIRISMPLIDIAQVAVHMPLMGNRGVDMIMETVEAYFNPLK